MRIFSGVLGFHVLLAGGFLAFGSPVKGLFLSAIGLTLSVYGFWPKREAQKDESGKKAPD